MGRRAAVRATEWQPRDGGPGAPDAAPAPGCGCGGCPQGTETPSSHSAPDRTGRGRRGRDGAVSHFPFQPQTHTHTHAPGTPVRGEPGPAPQPRARPAGARGGGGGEAPWPTGAGCTAHTHPPRPPTRGQVQLLPRESASVLTPSPGRGGHSPHNPGVASAAGHAEPAAPLSPGARRSRVHPRPPAWGRATKCVVRPQRRLGSRYSALAAPALQRSAPLLLSRRPSSLPLRQGLCAHTGSGRCVCPASPPPAPPPAVAASLSPRWPSALRACSLRCAALRCGSLLAPGADRAGR